MVSQYIHLHKQENGVNDVNIIADIVLEFINPFQVHVFLNLVFKPKSITYSIR